jgi:hypothetical protein
MCIFASSVEKVRENFTLTHEAFASKAAHRRAEKSGESFFVYSVLLYGCESTAVAACTQAHSREVSELFREVSTLDKCGHLA